MGGHFSNSFASGREARGAPVAAILAHLPAAARRAGGRCSRQVPRQREKEGRPGEPRACFCPLEEGSMEL